jgi:ABC-type transport system involved in multi-copper enzyme maturation permease subunit
MTRRTLVQAIAIIRKELREQKRSGWLFILGVVGFASYAQWLAMRSYIGMSKNLAEQEAGGLGPAQILALAPSLSLVFVGPMVIPFLGNGFLSRSLLRERLLGTLIPILATGVDPGVVWAAKVLAAFLGCYLVTLACIVIDLFIIAFQFHLPVTLSPATVVTVFFIAPLAGLAVLAIMSFLFWTVRGANYVAATLPVIVSTALFGYVTTHAVTELPLRAAAYTGVGAVVVITVCAMGINRLSRQFVVGLR